MLTRTSCLALPFYLRIRASTQGFCGERKEHREALKEAADTNARLAMFRNYLVENGLNPE